jgi:hypothetical protein
VGSRHHVPSLEDAAERCHTDEEARLDYPARDGGRDLASSGCTVKRGHRQPRERSSGRGFS